MLAAIEAGGTKFVCTVSDAELTIVESIKINTSNPKQTMGQVFEFFDKYPIKAIGIGSFGPIDVNSRSKTYGNITTTPKVAWRDYPLLNQVKERYAVPIAFTTDVNSSAYGEYKLGAGRGLENILYLTIGTGIGGGYISHGQVYSGVSHPEMGHILIQKEKDDEGQSMCPFHENCVEGLAAGPAIENRWGQKGIELGQNAQVWKLEANYLAQALVTYTVSLRPDIIILGGGVMHQPSLLGLIQEEFQRLLNGYVEIPALKSYIVKPVLGDLAGTMGCLLLAQEQLQDL
ncbi:ROK family protein [Granulicatella sp. s8]|uniref:fructokinase n=2 Tax=Granulicatella seriolae TaxID=2967226 RepID=A0ABT1WQ71_9LACT|nr:ROK family protein [Granulicatella seriolae]